MPSDARLKVQLRSVLGAAAADEPLPDDLLRVPDRWVRPGVPLSTIAVLATAMSAVVLVAAVALVLRPALAPSIGGPSTAVIGGAIGVPTEQVLATDDGWVAVRRSGDVLQLLVIRALDGNIAWRVVDSTAIPQPAPSVPSAPGWASVIAGQAVSCRSADHLRDGLIVYAYATFGTLDPARTDDPARWTVYPDPSHLASSGRFLVATLTSDGWEASGGRPNAVKVDALAAKVGGGTRGNHLSLKFSDSVPCLP